MKTYSVEHLTTKTVNLNNNRKSYSLATLTVWAEEVGADVVFFGEQGVNGLLEQSNKMLSDLTYSTTFVETSEEEAKVEAGHGLTYHQTSQGEYITYLSDGEIYESYIFFSVGDLYLKFKKAYKGNRYMLASGRIVHSRFELRI